MTGLDAWLSLNFKAYASPPRPRESRLTHPVLKVCQADIADTTLPKTRNFLAR